MRTNLVSATLLGFLAACGGAAPGELDIGEGLIGDGTAVAVDFEAVQARVTGTCTEGAVTAVAADGTVTCAPAGAAVDHDHDADYAAIDHTHDDYVQTESFTGHNNASCDDDKGFLVLGNYQEEFGCSVTCEDLCERHGMTCDSARTVTGTFRTCTSINNNESLYCWCKG